MQLYSLIMSEFHAALRKVSASQHLEGMTRSPHEIFTIQELHFFNQTDWHRERFAYLSAYRLSL